MLTARVLAASLLPMCASAAAAQRQPDHVILAASDPAATEVSFVLNQRGPGRVTITALGIRARGDTLTLRVNPGDLAVLTLPAGDFVAELRALPGSTALAAHLVPGGTEAPRRGASAQGPVLRIVRDAGPGSLALGAAAR